MPQEDDHLVRGPAVTERRRPPVTGPDRPARRFPGTDLPVGLMLGLVALGLPRTVLADLGIVAPESSLLYYVLALLPFAVWLTVAVVRRSRRPFRDFLVLGILYGLTLVVVHQLLWDVGPSLGHQPPDGALAFAARFSADWRDLALRGYTVVVALLIGLGTGAITGLVAVLAGGWRSRSGRPGPAR